MKSPSQLETLFYAARARSSAQERAAYLDDACAGDTDLRSRLERMLAAEAAGFLDAPPDELAATVHYPALERVGTVVGPYKLLQQIGEGGMGVVFMAEQSAPIQRTVALKIIKPGMDTRQVIARFEAERQAVALMDHPNIARVLDAGTTDSGRPYFVMELVRGVPITEYCDLHQLSPRERIELFLPVCQAVQHAHQKGIIHRDLKPSNILVAEFDHEPVAKVIDFGVAKATAQRLTHRTLFTEFGQVMGTVDYMSPEQAKLNQLDVDTRSDIYSLGVLLYELLTGETPHDRQRLRSAAFDEVLRIIREDEPPRPSTRLSSGATPPEVASNRRLEPAKLARLVRGELDWIVMKCLEKDRNRRYETASSLAADLEHYLRDEPVQACPPSAFYRVKKFVRRYSALVTYMAGLTFAMILSVASIMSLVQQREAKEAALGVARTNEARAIAEAARATAVTRLLQEALEAANPDSAKGADYTVREMLDDISARLNDELKDQPAAEASMRSTIGNAYRRLEMPDAAAPHLARALEIRQKLVGPDHESVALSLYDEAWNLQEGADYPRAIERIRRALEIHTVHGARNKDTVKFLALQQLILLNQGAYEESQQVGREALNLVEDLGASIPDAANIMHRLAAASLACGRFAEAEQLARESIPLHRKLHGEHHPETAYGLAELADALVAQQRSDEAEPHYREAFSIFSRQYAGLSRAWLGAFARWTSILNANGKQKEVEQLRADVVSRMRYSLKRRPDDVSLLAQAAAALRTVGDVDEAIAVLSQLLAKSSRDDEAWAARGDCYRLKGDYALMAQDYSEALALRQDNHWYWHERAYAYMLLGEHAKAVADHTEAIKLDDHEPGQRIRRAKAHFALGDVNSAVADCHRALELDQQSPFQEPWGWNESARAILFSPGYDESHGVTALALAEKAAAKLPTEWLVQNTLALAQLRERNYAESIKSVKEAMRLRSGGDAFDWFILAIAQRQLGKESEARRWAEKAVEWMDRALPEHVELKQLRAEANDLLGVSDPQTSSSWQSAPSLVLHPEQVVASSAANKRLISMKQSRARGKAA